MKPHKIEAVVVTDNQDQVLGIQIHQTIKLRKLLNEDVGFSGHGTGIAGASGATALEAKVIEKHVTTSKLLNGPDHRTSFTIAEFKSLVHKIRNTE